MKKPAVIFIAIIYASLFPPRVLAQKRLTEATISYDIVINTNNTTPQAADLLDGAVSIIIRFVDEVLVNDILFAIANELDRMANGAIAASRSVYLVQDGNQTLLLYLRQRVDDGSVHDHFLRSSP